MLLKMLSEAQEQLLSESQPSSQTPQVISSTAFSQIPPVISPTAFQSFIPSSTPSSASLSSYTISPLSHPSPTLPPKPAEIPFTPAPSSSILRRSEKNQTPSLKTPNTESPSSLACGMNELNNIMKECKKQITKLKQQRKKLEKRKEGAIKREAQLAQQSTKKPNKKARKPCKKLESSQELESQIAIISEKIKTEENNKQAAHNSLSQLNREWFQARGIKTRERQSLESRFPSSEAPTQNTAPQLTTAFSVPLPQSTSSSQDPTRIKRPLPEEEKGKRKKVKKSPYGLRQELQKQKELLQKLNHQLPLLDTEINGLKKEISNLKLEEDECIKQIPLLRTKKDKARNLDRSINTAASAQEYAQAGIWLDIAEKSLQDIKEDLKSKQKILNSKLDIHEIQSQQKNQVLQQIESLTLTISALPAAETAESLIQGADELRKDINLLRGKVSRAKKPKGKKPRLYTSKKKKARGLGLNQHKKNWNNLKKILSKKLTLPSQEPSHQESHRPKFWEKMLLLPIFRCFP